MEIGTANAAVGDAELDLTRPRRVGRAVANFDGSIAFVESGAHGLVLVPEARIELNEDVVFGAVLFVATPAGLFAEGFGGGFLLAIVADEVVISPAFGDGVLVLDGYFDADKFAFELALFGRGSVFRWLVHFHDEHGFLGEHAGFFEGVGGGFGDVDIFEKVFFAGVFGVGDAKVGSYEVPVPVVLGGFQDGFAGILRDLSVECDGEEEKSEAAHF